MSSKRVAVIGGGLAGIAAANDLQNSGFEVRLFEATDRLGGKLKTDHIDGFLIDHGFQVHFTAYPSLKHINPSLELRPFRNGAMIIGKGQPSFIDKSRPIATLLSSAFGFKDKLLTLKLTQIAGSASKHSQDQTIETFLKGIGFSDAFLNHFAKPFLGGIFVDRTLQGSAKMFLKVWNELGTGQTVLPKRGIQAIPEKLAEGLLDVQLNSPIDDLESLRSEFDAVIVATPAHVAAKLTGLPIQVETKHSTTFYFSTERPVHDEPYLILNAGLGKVNHFAPLSVVQPSYAQSGHLASATVLDLCTEEDWNQVKSEIDQHFSSCKPKLVKMILNEHAQLKQSPDFQNHLPAQTTSLTGVFLAGEYTKASSINDAVESGQQAAQLCQEYLK
jgi:protoporphyrinogen oxidase